MKHVTFDKSTLQRHQGLASQRCVLHNASADKFLLLQDISLEVWREVGEEVEHLYVSAAMDAMATYRADRNVIRAFDAKPYDDGTPGKLHYLRPKWINEVAPNILATSKERNIAKALASLSEHDQKALWEKVRPGTFAEVDRAFCHIRANKPGLKLDVVFGSVSPVEMIDRLIGLLAVPTKASEFKRHRGGELIAKREFKKIVHIILTVMWRKNLLLYSLGMANSFSPDTKAGGVDGEAVKGIRTGSLVQVLKNEALFPPSLYREMCLVETREALARKDDTQNLYISWFLLSTTCASVADLSPELLSETRNLKLRSYKWWEPLRVAFERANGPASFPVPPRSRIQDEVRTRSLEWVLREDPGLHVWTELFERMFATEYKTYTPEQYVTARHFFRWMLALPQWPMPQALSPAQVRNDGADADGSSFREYLDSYVTVTTRRPPGPLRPTSKSAAMRQLHRVMQCFRSENLGSIERDPSLIGHLRVDNPVQEGDWIWKAHTPTRTYRSAIDADILEFGKGVLLGRDRAGRPEFIWVQSHPSFKRDWIVVDGSNSGKWPFERKTSDGRVEVWQPTRALAVYLMLELPLRGFQVRWLDSGEGDEFIWDVDSAMLIRNESSSAQVGRAFGAIRPLGNDVLSGNEGIGLFVPTNKTQMWNPEDFRGFTIPWPERELYELLELQRKWCAFIATIFYTEPIKLSDDDLNIHPKVIDILPYFHVLFRDASNFAGGNRPISIAKIEALWVELCAEIQDEWARRGTPVRLIANRTGALRHKKRALHDLHTLRVSGITSLYLKGVPVEIISKYIAGHASIAMTLHYEASDPREIRRRLERYRAGAENGNGQRQAARLIERLESGEPLSPELALEVFGKDALSRMLMSNQYIPEGPVGIEAARHVSGSWVWFGDGICPGAKCTEGDESGGPVKGGPRSCGNCRFFLTGTAFLYGQAHRCNELMYELRRLGLERESWYTAKRRADPGSQSYAKASAMIDELDARIEPKLSDWWARYQLLQKSMKAAEQSGGDESRSEVARSDAAGGVTISAEVTNHVHLLKELAQSSDILKMGQENLAPAMELNAIINVILSKCGVEPFLMGIPDRESRGITTIVAEAIGNLFRMHYSCADTAAYARMSELAENTNASVDPVLAAALSRVATALKPLTSERGSAADKILSTDRARSLPE